MADKKTITKSPPGETFIVRLTSPIGENWQGNVIWVDERCQQQFSSMQELVELMNNTLRAAESEGDTDPVENKEEKEHEKRMEETD